MTRIYTLIVVALTAVIFASCSKGASGPPYDFEPGGMPRLIVRGTVQNTDQKPLRGIHISVFDLREPNEKDILTYNCALTDSAGRYTMIRYRGRELPSQISVVATDSSFLYQEQVLTFPVTYDSTYLSTDEKAPFNAYVTADFILIPNP